MPPAGPRPCRDGQVLLWDVSETVDGRICNELPATGVAGWQEHKIRSPVGLSSRRGAEGMSPSNETWDAPFLGPP